MASSVLVIASATDVISWKATPATVNGSGGEYLFNIETDTDTPSWINSAGSTTANSRFLGADIAGAGTGLTWENTQAAVSGGVIVFT